MKITADRLFHGCLVTSLMVYVVALALKNDAVLIMSCIILGVGLVVIVVHDCRERNRTISEYVMQSQVMDLDRDLTMLLIRARGAEFGFHVCPVCSHFNDNENAGLPKNYCDNCNRLTHEPPAPIER